MWSMMAHNFVDFHEIRIKIKFVAIVKIVKIIRSNINRFYYDNRYANYSDMHYMIDSSQQLSGKYGHYAHFTDEWSDSWRKHK